MIMTTTTTKFKVVDIQSYGRCMLHTGRVTPESIPLPPDLSNQGGGGESSSILSSTTATRPLCCVDKYQRDHIAPNHSMNHILNMHLHTVLGDNVDKRGPLCNEEKLRFDFSNKKVVTNKQMREVERNCSNCIIWGYPIL